MSKETVADVLELAARVEAASGPDRELENAVFYDHLGFCRHARTERSNGQSDTGFDCLDCGADSWGNLGSKGQRLHDKPPAYTASLDAAMSLVPEGWNWMAGNRNQPDARAYVENGELAFEGAAFRRNPKRQWFEVVAATPALALCAAALKARAGEGSGL